MPSVDFVTVKDLCEPTNIHINDKREKIDVTGYRRRKHAPSFPSPFSVLSLPPPLHPTYLPSAPVV